MYIGNLMLLILNLPLIGVFVQLLKVPYGILSPLIIMFVLLGAYALNNSVTDVFVTDPVRGRRVPHEAVRPRTGPARSWPSS